MMPVVRLDYWLPSAYNAVVMMFAWLGTDWLCVLFPGKDAKEF